MLAFSTDHRLVRRRKLGSFVTELSRSRDVGEQIRLARKGLNARGSVEARPEDITPHMGQQTAPWRRVLPAGIVPWWHNFCGNRLTPSCLNLIGRSACSSKADS